MDEWWLVFVPDSDRWGPLPPDGVLGIQDLPAAVERVGLRPGDPVFVRPDFAVEADLLEFVLSQEFRGLERETRRNYATDIRLLLSWLWQRGVPWRQATRADLRAYREFRCDSPKNPNRISGSKWDREAAAFTRLYRWARVVPLPVDVGRREGRAAHARSSRVSWLTPRTWGLWQDLGLRGLGRDGAPVLGWDARTELRNTAFVGLTLSSGLRRQEAGAMLTFEIPSQPLRFGRYCHGHVPRALSRSKRDRTFYVSTDALRQVGAYSESERVWSIERAQEQGRYERACPVTTALACEADPFVLPKPGPDTPVVQDRWISANNTHPNSRYSDDLWSLGPLTDNPGHPLHQVIWSKCPTVLQPEMRLIIWTLINGELRPSYVQARSMQGRARDGVLSMRNCILEWLKLARWLHRHGVTRLRECTAEHWTAFAATRTAAQNNRGHALKLLRWLSDLWAFDQLSAQPSGVISPPWESEGVDDYLPAATGDTNGENRTEPVDPTVIGPLLTWSIRLVEDFGDDILAAWAERRRMIAQVNATTPTPETLDTLRQYLLSHIDAQAPLPAMQHRGRGMTLNRLYIAAVTGAAYSQIQYLSERLELPKLTAQRPGPCTMQVRVTGVIEGRPWREHLDFEEAPTLVRHLATAAAVVILYLTGMRPQEARTLRSGCCPDPGSAGPPLQERA